MESEARRSRKGHWRLFVSTAVCKEMRQPARESPAPAAVKKLSVVVWGLGLMKTNASFACTESWRMFNKNTADLTEAPIGTHGAPRREPSPFRVRGHGAKLTEHGPAPDPVAPSYTSDAEIAGLEMF